MLRTKMVLVSFLITLSLLTGGIAMAQNPIVTINNVSVYSDKQMSGVSNTRVTFADGSWCDVATGEVVNKGPGYINIGAPATEEEGERITVGPERYATGELDVANIEADIDIQPIDGNKMEVRIEGPKAQVDAINVQAHGRVLSVSGKEDSGMHVRGSNVTITGGSAFVGGNISIGGARGGRIITGNTTVIMSSGGESDVKVTIGVPKGSSVKIGGVQGNTNIGDTQGPLQASVLGGDDIKAGKVTSANLSVQGSGNINVASVSESLSMNIQGSGDIRVRSGAVNFLNASIMGSGDARFRGKATNASLSIMGSGNIDVDYVKNKPSRSVMGHGDINVGNW